MSDSREAVLRRVLALKTARESFPGYVRLRHPDWKLQPFHHELANALDAIGKGELVGDDGQPVTNILVNMPPRFGKSEYCTKLFPAWYLGRDPRRHVMSVSYNAVLARDFGREVRESMMKPPTRQVFPDLELALGARSADALTTTRGGHYFSIGLRATTSGRPATCFVGDTPVATPQGPVPIRDLRVGDRVFGYDHATKQMAVETVVATQKTLRQAIDAGPFRCTADHPIWDTEASYVPARLALFAQDMAGAKVALLRAKPVEPKDVEVWDIQVSRVSNFYAGTPAVLVSNCLIVDDPHKSRADVRSKSARDDMWSYYTSALDARLQPDDSGLPPIRVVVSTRWSPDDFSARIMQTDSWERGEWFHLCYPAILDDASRTVLWPERFPYEVLADKRKLDPLEFSALYQQQPYVEGGEILRSEWWKWYSDEHVPATFAMVIIVADTAIKGDELADFSVFQAWGLCADGNVFLLDQHRERMEFPDLKRRLPSFCARWRGRGLRGVYIEDMASGSALVQELKRETSLPILPWRSFKDKVMRANTVSPLIESGRVFLPSKEPWSLGFVRECEQFPNGPNDDQVDCATMALDVLTRVALPSSFAVEMGESLLEEYNRSRELVVGKQGSLAQQQKLKGSVWATHTWKGWGQ
jgi:predicted phage terminase large subunit-like protein